MSSDTDPVPSSSDEGVADDVIELHRRTLDKILITFGALTTIVFLVAGGLLAWGASFADDYVNRELAAQNVFFPDAADLREEGRDDLVGRAGDQVTTGAQAEDYANYIGGHLDGIADGKTYSEIDDRGAAAAVEAAVEAGASETEVADLQTTADQLKGQRDTLFKGETLRGLLLTTYAWSTVGQIAGYAAIAVIIAALAMGALTIAGLVHLRRH